MDSQLAQKIFQQLEQGYDAIAEHFSQTRQAPWREVQNMVEQYVHPAERILDLGCGNGRLADLADTIKASYTGLDMSPQLIHIAEQQHPTGRFYVGNMLHTDFADNMFDHVFMIASFHHIPSRQYRLQTMNEVQRIIKPGGMIVMTNWNKYQARFWRLRLRHAWGLLAHTGEDRMGSLDRGDVRIPWHDQNRTVVANRYYHFFTARELRNLARQANLQVVDMYYETQGRRMGKHGAANIVTVLTKMV